MNFKITIIMYYICLRLNNNFLVAVNAEHGFVQLVKWFGLEYFTSGSRVGFTPSTYVEPIPSGQCFNDDVTNCIRLDLNSLILQDIFIAHDWTYSVIGGSLIKYNLTEEIKYEYYILVSTCPDPHDVMDEIATQMQRIKYHNSWNPRAKFLILATQQQQNNTNFAADVLAVVWRFKVASAILVVTSTRGFTLDIYTWFPYSVPGRCANIKDSTFLDQWLYENGTERFLYNKPLFPKKIPHDFHGCPLRISTFEYPPFIFDIKHFDNGTIKFQKGLEFKLIELIAETTNMTKVFQKAPPDGGNWGVLLDNGTWTGITREIMEDYSDVGMAGWWYRCHLIKEMECPFPHLIDACRWFVPCAKPYPRWMSTTRVFKLPLWLSFLSAYVVASLAIWQVVKINNSISTEPIENQAYTSLVKCLLNFWAIILEESASNNPPHVGAIRTVFLVWVLYCWAVNTVYQTFLTSFLIDPGLQHAVTSEEELLSSKLKYGIPDTIVSIVPSLSSDRYRLRDHCDDLQGCRDRLAFKGDFALFFSKYNMEYLAAAKYMDPDGKSMVCKFSDVYCNQLTIMPVPTGLLMLELFNDLILHVYQSGLMEYWWNDLRYTATLDLAKDLNEPVGEYIKLTLEHLQSAFYLLFLGCIFSIIAFISEITCQKRDKR